LKLNVLKIGVLVIFLVGMFSGCSIKKYIKKDEFLVNKYKLKLETKHEELDPSDLRDFFRPKPNSKTLGIHWKLHNYFKSIEKPTKFNKWRNKNFGEYPAMYSGDDADRIEYKMEKYLDNIGFFHSKVKHTVEFKKKSVNLIYTVKPAQPYLISEISYDVSDTVLNGFFKKNIEKTLIKEGDIYNAYTFDNERDRITTDLRNVGYYYFNRNFIQFIVDTAFAGHSMTVVLKINKIREQVKGVSGQFTEKDHRRYFIKNVDVIPDWKPMPHDVYDTVLHQIKFWDDKTDNFYYFLLDEKKRIKPQAFNSTIKIKPEHAYSAEEVQKTYRGLFNFRIIRTATITFDTTGAGMSEDGAYSYMNSRIQMQTAKLNSFQAELEGTNSSGDLGIRGSVVLANKNIFKRADVFSVRVNGGFEAQSFSDSLSDYSLFNTFEAGVSGNFFFPRFLFPGKMIKFNQKYAPVTNLNFGYNYQHRQNYDRYITNIDFGYRWDQTQQIRHIITPISINYVNIYANTDEFREEIENEQNPRLKEQYSDHLTAGLSYSFIFNNQNLKILEHFNYFRANIETSGNLLYGLNKAFSPQKTGVSDTTEGYYTVGDVRYAQYVRFNFDYRHYYFFFDKSSSVALRFLLGIGIPYLNSNEMPYEKAFFAGGANDMRGWEFRTLGPGGFSGTSDYERSGDIQIEGNVEYRFTIYSVLKGAFFIDVGNIWLLPNNNDTISDQDVLEGVFDWNTWYQQLAVDAGFGLRLDFKFFIFRLDMAIPIVDPAYWGVKTEDQMKQSNSDPLRLPIEWHRTIFNFGIGYPF